MRRPAPPLSAGELVLLRDSVASIDEVEKPGTVWTNHTMRRVLATMDTIKPPDELRCFLCRRDVSDGMYRNLDWGLAIQRVCDICWEKSDA